MVMPLVGQAAQQSIDFFEHCRNCQLQDGYLKCENGRYLLTEKGKKLVQKELKRYELRPGMMVLIEQQILEAHDLEVY
jgi:hypothetical protein